MMGMMGSPLNREERATLRHIQTHMREAIRAQQTIVEQLGTVDVYFHPSNPDPFLNCVTPHRGVAWVRRDDLSTAFAGLERLGRVPRLIFQDALFPAAFQQQLLLMGLTLEVQKTVLVYHPMLGPLMPDETPRERVPEQLDPAISVITPKTEQELAVWLRVFRAGYYNTELLAVDPEVVKPLVAAAQKGDKVFVMANYERTPLGAARLAVYESSAEIEAVVTAPLWHGMGLEAALITMAINSVMERGVNVVFTVAPAGDIGRLYRQMGFVEMTRVLTFWLTEDQDRRAARVKGVVNS
jgi:ribosomal protein S18 acetylase RimI-like enzyme